MTSATRPTPDGTKFPSDALRLHANTICVRTPNCHVSEQLDVKALSEKSPVFAEQSMN